MSSSTSPADSSPFSAFKHRRQWLNIAVLLIALVAVAIFSHLRTKHRDAQLLLDTNSQLIANVELMQYGSRRGAPLYKEHCASCHGNNMEGNRARGIPNLEDSVWLYGTGTITDIEQTILYGIRSGHPKSHNLADMPGFGRIGQLNKADIDDVVEYILKISGQPHDDAAATRGKDVYADRGVCYDCHAGDAQGVSDYGTPALTGRGGSWLYGGDRATLYKSAFDGRHGLCPSWIQKLNFLDVRSLAIYVYAQSHRPSQNNSANAPTTHPST